MHSRQNSNFWPFTSQIQFFWTISWKEFTGTYYLSHKHIKIFTHIFFSFSFINGLEMVHIVGTYEKAELEEGEVYEVVNIKTLKQATPNLRIINLYGVSFVDDTHVEAFSSNCIQLQVRKLSKWVCRICLFFQKKKLLLFRSTFSILLINATRKRRTKSEGRTSFARDR